MTGASKATLPGANSVRLPKIPLLSSSNSGYHPLQINRIWFIAIGMTKTYVIQWKSKVNGRAGRGTKLFTREEGDQLVQELNMEYPQIHHELYNTEGRATTEALPAPPELNFAPA